MTPRPPATETEAAPVRSPRAAPLATPNERGNIGRRRQERRQCPPHTPRHCSPHGSAALSPAQAEWPRMRRRSPHAVPASRAYPGRRGAHPAPHTAPRERTRVGLGHACFSTALPAVRTITTSRSTKPHGFGLSPVRFPRCSVMKNSASSSCGSVKISFYTYPTEANSSPFYSIEQSAPVC